MRPVHKPSPRGQTLVEFAIILPLFALMLWVIFDLGRVAYYYSQVYNAAREGARFAITDYPGPPNLGEVEAVAENLAAGMDLTVGVQTADDTITVTVSYTYVPVSPVLNILVGKDNLLLRSRATMQKEY